MRLTLKTLCFLATLACFAVSSVQAQWQRSPEAEEAYQAGVEALEQENWEAALNAFSSAIDMDDIDAEAMIGRGDALRELEDYSNAQQSYTSALTINDKLARAHYGLGVCAREIGDDSSAFASFYNAVDIDRNDPEIAAALGDLLVNIPGSEDLASGKRFLDKAIELDPTNAEALRNRARAHAMLDEPEKALEDLAKSAEIDPSAYETFDTIARVHINEKNYPEAIKGFDQAIEVYTPEKDNDPPFYTTGYLDRARTKLTYAAEKDTPDEIRERLYADILSDTQKVLEEYPDRMPEAGYALHRQGQALRLQERYGEAIKAYTEAIQLIPGGRNGPYAADAYLKRGICWHYQGQDSLARPDFEMSASIQFEDPLPHLWIGYSYAQEGNYREAIKHYGDAIAKSPDFAMAFVNRGLSYMQLEEFKKAVDNFNEAIRNEPTESKHYYKRGVAHLKLEEYQKALDSFDHAIRYDSENVKFHRGAVAALRALGRDNLASQHEQKIRELEQ